MFSLFIVLLSFSEALAIKSLFLNDEPCMVKPILDINLKAFNIKTNKNEAKTMTEHISCDCKCKFNSTTSN